MRKVALAALLVILLSPLASAETYRISGKATYADTTPVSLDYVYVECEVGAYECYQYRGTKAILTWWFHSGYRCWQWGRWYWHFIEPKRWKFHSAIDLVKHQNSAEGKVWNKAQPKPTPSGVFIGFGCFIVLFVLVFVSVLLRTGALSTKEGRLEFMGYRKAPLLECPVCQEMVYQHEMVKHLIVDHDIEPFEAGEMTGKVMRKTWTEEE